MTTVIALLSFNKPYSLSQGDCCTLAVKSTPQNRKLFKMWKMSTTICKSRLLDDQQSSLWFYSFGWHKPRCMFSKTWITLNESVTYVPNVEVAWLYRIVRSHAPVPLNTSMQPKSVLILTSIFFIFKQFFAQRGLVHSKTEKKQYITVQKPGSNYWNYCQKTP